MATINLAPGTQYLASVRRRRRMIFSASAIVVLVAGVVWLGAFLYSSSLAKEITQGQANVSSLDTKIAAVGPDVARIKLFEGRLYSLESLLDTHVVWTPLFADIEKLLPAPIVLTTLNIRGEEGIVEVSANAPDIDQIAQTLASLTAVKNPGALFSSGHISSVRRAEVADASGQAVGTSYQFDAKLLFDAERLRLTQATSNTQ